jgi:hypothetical protein
MQLADKRVWMNYSLLARSVSFVAGVALLQCLSIGLARAQTAADKVDAPARKSSSSAPASSARSAHTKAWSTAEEPYIGAGAPHFRYFVEFRARNAASYGHVYVMFGEVNARHEIIKSEIAGLFPAGDARGCENCSIYNWTIGHVLPVPSEIGASDGDLEEQYVLARFRLWVDADQYKRLSAYIKERKADKGPWNALFANCVSFGRDVASVLDLNIPPKVAMGLVYPQGFVEALREANGLKHEQLSLRDASGSFPWGSGNKRQAKVSPAEGAAKTTAAQAAAGASSASTGGSAQ